MELVVVGACGCWERWGAVKVAHLWLATLCDTSFPLAFVLRVCGYMCWAWSKANERGWGRRGRCWVL